MANEFIIKNGACLPFIDPTCTTMGLSNGCVVGTTIVSAPIVFVQSACSTKSIIPDISLSGTTNTACCNGFVVAGSANNSFGCHSAIISGVSNNICATSLGTAIIGSSQSTINNNSCRSVIIGGNCNAITGNEHTIIGGCNNTITTASYIYNSHSIINGIGNTICGGVFNTILGAASGTISGYGSLSAINDGGTIQGSKNSIIGGCNNTNVGCCINGMFSTSSSIICNNVSLSAIVGGDFNCIMAGSRNSITGGRYNCIISGYYNTVSGGYCNNIEGDFLHIGGGRNNYVTGQYSAITGGQSNYVMNARSFIGGGCNNTNSGAYSVIGGGKDNFISSTSYNGFIGGGYANTICSVNNASSAILGGFLNYACADYTGVFGCCITNSIACSFAANKLWACNLVGSTVAVCVGTNGLLVRGASDCRLKTDIQPLSYGLDAISRLNPVSFNWCEQYTATRGTEKQIGFIAQEVEPVIPEAVGMGAEDGLYSFSPDKIVAVLTKAVQELSLELKEVKAILAKNSLI